MRRTITACACGLLLVAVGCGEGNRSESEPTDCSIESAYEFRSISDFTGSDPGWFLYTDPTPGGFPDASESSDVPIDQLEGDGRCGDTRALKLEAYGHNFWGTGFGDWAHNSSSSRADGTGYEGISFWVRSAPNRDMQFLLNVDDRRTAVLPPESTGGSPAPATASDQDLDGDGYIGAGDIVAGTECRLPPSSDYGEVACYNGGVDPPSNAVRIPDADECGNAFHTLVQATTEWQLKFVPWRDLVQWPCPNRLEGGIDPSDIAKFEIKFEQGTHYELWIDNIAFYRRRASAGG